MIMEDEQTRFFNQVRETLIKSSLPLHKKKTFIAEEI